MAKAKTGDRYVCDECGMVVSVEEACTCDACGIVCCDVPMVKAPGAARKAKKKAAPAKARRAPKKAKAAVKRMAARK
jgi:predicted ATP-dependent serine protease